VSRNLFKMAMNLFVADLKQAAQSKISYIKRLFGHKKIDDEEIVHIRDDYEVLDEPFK